MKQERNDNDSQIKIAIYLSFQDAFQGVHACLVGASQEGGPLVPSWVEAYQVVACREVGG